MEKVTTNIFDDVEQILTQMEELRGRFEQEAEKLRSVRSRSKRVAFRQQLELFARSDYYSRQRAEFLAEVAEAVIDYRAANRDTPFDEMQHYLVHRQTLYNHCVYGMLLKEFPGLHVNPRYLNQAVNKMMPLHPDNEEDSIIQWLNLLTAVQLDIERNDWAVSLDKKRQQEKENRKLVEMRMAEALRTMQDRELFKNKYDYLWPMLFINETRTQPLFANVAEYAAWLQQQGLVQEDYSGQMNRKRFEFKERFPLWTFKDESGKKRAEHERRILLVEHFQKLMG